MTYPNAKKLHNEDEVIHKYTNRFLRVVEIAVDAMRQEVYVLCDDGNWYHHRTIK